MRGTYSALVMPLSSDTLRTREARRIALHAQGFTDAKPAGRVDRRHFCRVLDRVGLVQIDSVNVLTRSHELPFLARLGPYDRAALSGWLWSSGDMFEYWGHEASLLPVERQPLLRWRMAPGHAWGGMVRVSEERPELVHQLLDAVAERGPVTLGELEHLGDAISGARRRPGTCGTGATPRRRWSGSSGTVRCQRSATRPAPQPRSES